MAPERPALAWQSVAVQRDGESVYAAPGGARLGRLVQGTSVAPGQTRGTFTQFALEGWIFRGSVQPTNRDGHNLVVSQSPEENLRDGPNGRVIARLLQGCLLDEVERRGQWVRVRRTMWVATAALGAAREVAAAPPAAQARRDTAASRPAPPPVQAAETRRPEPVSSDPRRGVSRRRVNLYRAPDSAAVGSIEAGMPVRVTARAGEWVRIEAQAWVRESEIRVGDAGIMTGVSAAELRGAPDEFRGRLVRWTIQFIALQTADDLRPDFTPGQRYILARGPAPEYAFVYLIVPPSMVAEIQRLQPLASINVVARVVSGRSAYLANPILELVDVQ